MENLPPSNEILYIEDKPSSHARATPRKFQIVFKSDVTLGDRVSNIKLNLATKEITFTARETSDYKWTSWLVNVPPEESVTLFLMDDEGKSRCMLVMDGAYVFEHTCLLNNYHDAFGIDSPGDLEHKITVTFTSIERMTQHRQAILGSASQE